MSNFKVGDAVCNDAYGDGIVYAVDLHDKDLPNYPIGVKFIKYGAPQSFTREGWFNESTKNPRFVLHKIENSNMTLDKIFGNLERVCKMIAGTEIDIKDTIRFNGNPILRDLNLTDFRENWVEKYTFAQGLIENKPAFAGDTIWSTEHNIYKIIKEVLPFRGRVILSDGANVSILNCIWEEPKKKLLIGDTECVAPLPSNTNKRKDHGITLSGGIFIKRYSWETPEERDAATFAIAKLLESKGK